jgi:hypothetical protein
VDHFFFFFFYHILFSSEEKKTVIFIYVFVRTTRASLVSRSMQNPTKRHRCYFNGIKKTITIFQRDTAVEIRSDGNVRPRSFVRARKRIIINAARSNHSVGIRTLYYYSTTVDRYCFRVPLVRRRNTYRNVCNRFLLFIYFFFMSLEPCDQLINAPIAFITGVRMLMINDKH